MKKGNSYVAKNWVEKGLSEKDPDKKLHYFNLALELEPTNNTALNGKGMILYGKGMLHEAIECYDRILGQYNMAKSVPALYNKSLALKKMGRTEAALTFMNRALKQQPENEKIKNHVENLTLILESKEETVIHDSQHIPAKNLAVNQVYNRWEPPGVTTLLSSAMKCSKKEIKYYKGFGEDMIKEKIIREKLSQRIYCCESCKFSVNDICHHRETKAMQVSPAAICRNFRPV